MIQIAALTVAFPFSFIRLKCAVVAADRLVQAATRESTERGKSLAIFLTAAGEWCAGLPKDETHAMKPIRVHSRPFASIRGQLKHQAPPSHRHEKAQRTQNKSRSLAPVFKPLRGARWPCLRQPQRVAPAKRAGPKHRHHPKTLKGPHAALSLRKAANLSAAGAEPWQSVRALNTIIIQKPERPACCAVAPQSG